MLQGLAGNTSVIAYLMAAVGVIGIMAKIVNHITLRRLVKAAENMPKSTHRLIKLVRAKYEHACMIRDSVENIDAFVEKYIYEYRGFLFRIHTWRQIETLSVWFAGILAALGAAVTYLNSGFNESVYHYIGAGIAEMILLSVIIRLSDEPYKINAVRMYMTDYLENICTFRLKKQNVRDREFIDVISAEGNGKGGFQPVPDERDREETASFSAQESGRLASGMRASNISRDPEGRGMAPETAGPSDTAGTRRKRGAAEREGGLSINIEGEPRNSEKGEAARQAVRRAAESGADEERPALREEAIRQILEEFLA